MTPKQSRGRAVEQAHGRFSFDGLDRVMHEKARLGIIVSLAANPGGLSFNDLKQLCSLTDGNLSRHLGVLAESGLVRDSKGGTGARPQTIYRLTADGTRRFAEYLAVLERVVSDARPNVQPQTRRPRSGGETSPG